MSVPLLYPGYKWEETENENRIGDTTSKNAKIISPVLLTYGKDCLPSFHDHLKHSEEHSGSQKYADITAMSVLSLYDKDNLDMEMDTNRYEILYLVILFCSKEMSHTALMAVAII